MRVVLGDTHIGRRSVFRFAIMITIVKVKHYCTRIVKLSHCHILVQCLIIDGIPI